MSGASFCTIMASPSEGPRGLVKTTYAHKKGRVSKASGSHNIIPSSPLQILDAHTAILVPTTEMTRRMLKRSRQSQIPVHQQQREREQIEPSKPKRSKASNSNDIAQSYTVALNDLQPKSRNMKENNSSAFRKSTSSSRTLETSLSNHHSSPTGKFIQSKSKRQRKSRSNRPVLATKSISISSTTNLQDENTKNCSSAGTSRLNQVPTIANSSIPSKGTRKSLPGPSDCTLNANPLLT